MSDPRELEPDPPDYSDDEWDDLWGEAAAEWDADDV